MANTIEILINAKDAASAVINSIGDSLSSVGGSFIKTGAAITVATAGISAALITSGQAAINYSESMTNTAAVLGLTTDKQKELSDEILKFSEGTRAGPQAVANAFYDIVGGVADASTHMAILESATATAEAGNAELGSTTKALISVMNSYKFSAKDAAMASDVLTNVVGKGVGTMDEFAGALPQVTGLAHSLGISFTDVGAATAYLTTKGYNASVAVTQLRGMMVSLLNPNTNMTKGLQELGYKSGQAAIDALGLVGAMSALQKTQEAGKDGFASMAGSVEALNGVVALTDSGFQSFNQTFKETTSGATEAARAIQNSSPAAQLDLLNSSISALQISVGNTLLPILNDVVKAIKPIVSSVIDWIQKNPAATKTIVMMAGALSVLGPALIIIGTLISAIASPITLVIGAIAGLVIAFETNFMGIRTTLEPIIDWLSNGFDAISVVANGVIAILQGQTINGTGNLFTYLFGDGTNSSGGLQYVLESFGVAKEEAFNFINSLRTGFESAATFLTGTALPAFQTFFNWLGEVWAGIQPGLSQFANWFIQDALPNVVSFIQTTVLPGLQTFFNWLGNVWKDTIEPGLGALFKWFVNDGLPAISDFVTNTAMPKIQDFVDLLSGIWTTVQPFLDELFQWFTTGGLPPMGEAIDTLIQTIGKIPGKIQEWIDKQGPIVGLVEDLIIAGGIVTGVILAYNVVAGIAATVSAGVAGGITAIGAAINLMLGPIGLVIIGLTTLIALYKQVQTFQAQVNAAQKEAQPATQTAIAAGLTFNEYMDKAFASTASELGDAGARIFWANGGKQMFALEYLKATQANLNKKAQGSYALGTDFVPNTQMAVLHRGERVMTANENASYSQGSGGMNFAPGSIVIQANSDEEGQQAADGFMGRMSELMRSRDVVPSTG